jgi:hypothetical protein
LPPIGLAPSIELAAGQFTADVNDTIGASMRGTLDEVEYFMRAALDHRVQ